MTEADEPAYPPFDAGYRHYTGLTKRELFAAMAMQGLLANPETNPDYIPSQAAFFAEELIAELSKGDTP